MLRFGGAVSRGVVLSAELTGWSRVVNGNTESLSWATLVSQLYPDPSQGLYVKVGIGAGSSAVSEFIPGYGTANARTTAFGWEIGAGYDMHLSHGFSLTPYVDYLATTPTGMVVNGSNTGFDVGTNLFHFGLAASWR
jgi:hypothetical protein